TGHIGRLPEICTSTIFQLANGCHRLTVHDESRIAGEGAGQVINQIDDAVSGQSASVTGLDQRDRSKRVSSSICSTSHVGKDALGLIRAIARNKGGAFLLGKFGLHLAS